MVLVLIVSEKMKNSTKVYAAAADDDANRKALHISCFCFTGEIKAVKKALVIKKNNIHVHIIEQNPKSGYIHI